MNISDKKYKFVARKIKRGRWEDIPSIDEQLPACTISIDLKTDEKNTLSFWLCNLDNKSIHDVVLCISNSFKKPDPFDLVIIPVKKIKDELKIEIVETTSGVQNLPKELKKLHVDLRNLDIQNLCDLADLIAETIKKNYKLKVKTFYITDIIEIFYRKVKEAKVDKEPFKPFWKNILDAMDVALKKFPKSHAK